MSWFTENKVFSSLLVLIVLGVGVLAYLVFDARGNYDTAVSTYNSGVQQLVSLRSLSPYRDNENLKKINAQVVSYKELTSNLHEELIRRQGELAPVDPATFQARLRDSVSKIVANAAQKGVELPAKFYLGFDNYENQLPRNDITSLLSWQLSAVELVVNHLIDLRVTKITNIIRPPLPGEVTTEVPSKEIPLLRKFPFEVAFLSYPRDAKSILNDLVSTPEFMVVRAVKVENEALKGPLKVSENSSVSGPDGQPAPVAAIDKIIIGKEKVTTSIIIDLVQFTAKPTPKK